MPVPRFLSTTSLTPRVEAITCILNINHQPTFQLYNIDHSENLHSTPASMLGTRFPLSTACRALQPPVNSLKASPSARCGRRYLNTFYSDPASLSIRSRIIQSTKTIRLQIRSESTVAAPASSSGTVNPTQTLTWNRFLQLRKVRRRISLVASVTCAVTAFVGGVSYISANPEVETKISPALGLDPFITMGIMTFAFGACGWLAGPFVAEILFNLRYRSMTPMIKAVSYKLPIYGWDIANALNYRKRKSSLQESRNTESTRQHRPLETQYRIIMGRRLVALWIIEGG
jgi:import protein Pam17